MAYDLNDVLGSIRRSRQFFLKHLQGLRDDQWDWKPYPECKSITETLVHLVVDDRAALQSLRTGGEPDYEAISTATTEEAGGDRDRARAMLDASHARLCAFVGATYEGKPLDTEVSAWGAPVKLGGLGLLSSEDYYHAGQVAYIRMASDPAWDYYAAIYAEH